MVLVLIVDRRLLILFFFVLREWGNGKHRVTHQKKKKSEVDSSVPSVFLVFVYILL
eukprot:m.229780 g.229780  ORF g.229780 m.229780 type:complete len:56 (+) comp40050_c0_seq1:1303-1470(+)